MKSNKNQNGTKQEPGTNQNRRHAATRASLNARLKRVRAERDKYRAKFEIEKDCKNRAYYFILSNGLLESFADFCRGGVSNNPYKGA